MKQKQIIILSLVLSVLLVGTLIKTVIQKENVQTVPGNQIYGSLAFGFEPHKVETILIGRGMRDPLVELVKESGLWKVKGLWAANANEEKVDNFLGELRGARGEIRATGRDFFPDFGIRDAEAFFIKLIGAGNATLLDLRVGTKTTGSRGYFLRKANGDEVYFTDTNMAELLGIYTNFTEAVPSNSYWADLALFHADIDRTISVVMEHISAERRRTTVLGIRREGTESDLTKKLWSFINQGSSKKPVDSEKVLRLFVTLNSVQAQSVADPSGKDYGLDTPFLEITVTEKGHNEIHAIVSPKNVKEDVCFVKISNRPGIFKLSAHYLQDLDMKDEQLLKDNAVEKASSKTL